MMQSAAGKSGLQDQKALSRFAEQRIRRHPYSVVVHQGVPRLVRIRADQVVVGLQHQPFGAGGNQEGRCAGMDWDIGIGDRDDDEK
ncbi:Uncharacterised protein [Mycobacterium tuberculosis]|nr:Uncharacterised protein [Mycobacterium tuberculosis]